MQNIPYLAKKMNRLQKVFDSFEESAILLMDADLSILFLNHPASELLKNNKSQEAPGTSLPEIAAPCFLPIFKLIEQTFKERRSVKNHSLDCLKKNGQYQTFLVNTTLLEGKKPRQNKLMVILHDVTEMTQFRSLSPSTHKYGEIIGHSPKILEVYQKIESVKDYETNVLITGETGTGKEVVARTIHSKSNRKDKPFIPVQVTAMPESIVESEIFGHKKGAFTGAISSHPGRLKMADSGTLFLDEIGTFPESVQIKLLRFLEDKVIQPVGSDRRITVDVRIIAATNENLTDLVAAGKFREDLFYRLNVMEIIVPPLRERIEDLPELIHAFVTRLNQKYHKHIKGISPNVLKHLSGYSWPGNVRELENAIEHAFIEADGDIFTLKHFSKHIQNWTAKPKLEAGQENYSGEKKESQQIRRVLASCRGNINHASQNLHMHRSTLWRKMKEYNISKKEFSLEI